MLNYVSRRSLLFENHWGQLIMSCDRSSEFTSRLETALSKVAAKVT
ncbi:hypothetical protein H6G93_25585 [Nostoc sp. FACHB-973]|nr:hypothetical protein [Nostoc sp. FACHB-973]MBX9253628.1 hypothetical protein [Desmonostoc muscorum CCALA 125]